MAGHALPGTRAGGPGAESDGVRSEMEFVAGRDYRARFQGVADVAGDGPAGHIHGGVAHGLVGIGDIAVDWKTRTIWVGTGEVNSSRSSYAGVGIYKSADNGKTWEYLGLPETHHIGKILLHPTDSKTVWVASLGHLYTPNKDRGVFKTTDGGETWNKILFTNDTSGVADMIMDPSNPNKIFAAMWQHRRTPWSLSSGGVGSGLYMTYDGGKNWKKLGAKEGLPEGNYGRIGLAISRSNPNRVYA